MSDLDFSVGLLYLKTLGFFSMNSTLKSPKVALCFKIQRTSKVGILP